MAHRSRHRERHGLRVQGAAGRRAADAPAAPGGGVAGDGFGPVGWAAREQPSDLASERRLEVDVGRSAAFGIALLA